MNAREYWANGPDEGAEDRVWCDVLDGIHENEEAQRSVATWLAEDHSELIAALTTPSRYNGRAALDADLAELERVSEPFWHRAALDEYERRHDV